MDGRIKTGLSPGMAVDALKDEARVYYIEKDSTKVYEYTAESPVDELFKADEIFSVSQRR